MARVADVRRLGSAGAAVGAGIPEGERQFYTKPPPGMSRSKAGRSLSSSIGIKAGPGAGAGAGRGARGTPAHAQLSFAASSMRSASPSGGGRPASSSAGGGRRPSSRGDISSNSGGSQSRSGAGWSSGSIRFAAPEGSYGKQVVMEAQAAVAEEEDLFEVLQRRIEAQRSELREGRESIENVMKSEVAELQETVDGERREMQGVCSRYREALDEIARLKGLISASQSSVDAAVAAAEEARIDAAEERKKFEEEAELLRSEAKRMAQLLEANKVQEGRVGELAGALAASEAAMESMRVEAGRACALEMLATELRGQAGASAAAAAAAAAARDEAQSQVVEQVVRLEEERKGRMAEAEGRRAAEKGVEEAREAAAEERARWEADKASMQATLDGTQSSLDGAVSRASAAEDEVMRLKSELGGLYGELKHRDEAVKYAIEQVKCAEEEARAAGEASRNHQELAITLRGERDAAMAERDRVEKEREEAVAEVERLREAKGGEEGGDADGVESTSNISKVERSRSVSKVETKGGTTSKVVSSNTAPEGGGVAKGVGVTVNVHSKETVLSLQTTIKEKETLIQQVTTRLKATASELDQAKVFWKAAQAESSELQRQLRNEKSCRRDESNANKLASDKLGASLAREEARSGKLAEGLKEAEAAVRLLRGERDALQRSLDEARKSWSLERDAAKSAAAKAGALDAQVAAERQCRGKAENELASAKAKIEDDARLWASDRESLRRASDEREERWRGERDAMQSKISVAMGEAESAQRRMEMEREEHRSEMIDLEGRVEKERRESGAREDERVRELVSKRQREIDGKERQFKSSASKLLSSELAFESSITCMACLSIMSNPVTCTPCGHSTCSSCYHAAGNTCAECGLVGGGAIPNNALDAVCGKFSLRVQELEGLQQMLRGF